MTERQNRFGAVVARKLAALRLMNAACNKKVGAPTTLVGKRQYELAFADYTEAVAEGHALRRQYH